MLRLDLGQEEMDRGRSGFRPVLYLEVVLLRCVNYYRFIQNLVELFLLQFVRLVILCDAVCVCVLFIYL